MSARSGPTRRCIWRVRGAVQGVGFRPWVRQLAAGLGLTGWVRNCASSVEIQAQGSQRGLSRLERELRSAPAPIVVRSMERLEVDPVDEECAFEIAASDSVKSAEESSGAERCREALAPDLAICADCLRELQCDTDRRSGHSFVTCSRCGPRYSLTHQLPFDRSSTAMASFALCSACQREYEDTADRRFHAQTLSCPGCGPTLSFLPAESSGEVEVQGSAALARAIRVLREGQIVAVLGVGGYQLLTSATSDASVARLRLRKQRPSKPLAVLFPDIDSLRAYCETSDEQRALLESAAAPIVLLERLEGAALPGNRRALSSQLAPGSRRLGALLPTTALHWQLAVGVGEPLVCTSGNTAEEPILFESETARRRLSGVCDAFLSHDRRVVRPVDDSVAQVVGGRPQLLRRARGYAPGLAAEFPDLGGKVTPVVLALGAHQKSTLTLACAAGAFTSEHVGDLETVAAQSTFERRVESWLQLLSLKPSIIVRDLHDGYASSRLAEALARRWELPVRRVQHHHAHVAACAAEYGLDGPFTGLAWDGSGVGTDGTLWGGETLVCEADECHRVGHFEPFRLPGGAKAIRDPRCAALGWLHGAGHRAVASEKGWFEEAEVDLLWQAMDRGLGAPLTSSVGRLFDAAAALAGLFEGGVGGEVVWPHEGQLATAWMELAQASPATVGAYPCPVSAEGRLDSRALLEALLADTRAGVASSVRARRFHEALADAALAAVERVGLGRVALAGGCFQNALLTESVEQRLCRRGVEVRVGRRVPPNDAGVSLGQAWVVWQSLRVGPAA